MQNVVIHLDLSCYAALQEKTSTGTHVFLVDMSSNGTFVNGEKVGESCCCLLCEVLLSNKFHQTNGIKKSAVDCMILMNSSSLAVRCQNVG